VADEPNAYGKTVFQPKEEGGDGADRSNAEAAWFGNAKSKPADGRGESEPSAEGARGAADFEGPPPAPPPPEDSPGRIPLGTLLNHIYRVDAFLAQGGMGEVYVGTNVNTDERVAIKIILPHLAADPNVQMLFRNEARTLTRLSHPGLVQYRVLAQEPDIGVLYIVTEFIDGPSLADVMGTVGASPAETVSLTRRLASGLAAAHELGMIHRDISPDNVLLPQGRLDQAKIIDFGIAKDIDAAKRAGAPKTIIGSGFAGKLGFVAPEQFGDTRDVGPWTDVYSLALVMLSLARRKAVDMGATFAEAIEKRRTIPELAALPPNLRPVFARMLEPEPRRRYQSMSEVLAALEAAERSKVIASLRRNFGSGKWSVQPRGLFANIPAWMFVSAGAMLGVAVLFVIVMALLPSPPRHLALKTPPASSVMAQVAKTASVPPDALARINATTRSTLAAADCSWLDAGYPDASGNNVNIALSGVTGDSTILSSTTGDLTSSIQSMSLSSSIDRSAVGMLTPGVCPLLNGFGKLREYPSIDAHALIPKANRFYAGVGTEACEQQSPDMTMIAVDVILNNEDTDFSILEVDPAGGVIQLSRGLADLRQQMKTTHRQIFHRIQPLEYSDHRFKGYNLMMCDAPNSASKAADGYDALLLLTGKGPFDLGLSGLNPQQLSPGILSTLASKAQVGGWKAQMAWFRMLPR
jgi:serine/threonine-protein kinase